MAISYHLGGGGRGEGGGGGGWRMLVVLLVFQGEDYDGDLEEKKNIFITT